MLKHQWKVISETSPTYYSFNITSILRHSLADASFASTNDMISQSKEVITPCDGKTQVYMTSIFKRRDETCGQSKAIQYKL